MAFQISAFAQANGDCSSAKDICKKQTYRIDKVRGEGSKNNEADLISCFLNGTSAGQAEENSTWIKFEIEESGSLTFAITPLHSTDDIDFIVFKLPPDGNCDYKQIVRCMASGESPGMRPESPCLGATGLREGEKDTSEDAGCNDEGDNAWLAPLRVKAGEKYVILASNVTQPGPGFTISFAGTCKLPCDEDKKPIADKPKPKPTDKLKPTEPKPEVAKPIAAAVPENIDSIGGRKTEVKSAVTVKNRTIRLKIWDNQVEDGDVVSVFVDGKREIDHIELKNKPRQFIITLPPGKKEFIITVFADNFGKSEPNTASVLINDGVKDQTIDLVSGRKTQESIRVVLE